jgi:hypothetical protein
MIQKENSFELFSIFSFLIFCNSSLQKNKFQITSYLESLLCLLLSKAIFLYSIKKIYRYFENFFK